MSAGETPPARGVEADERGRRYGTIVVVGGGCYGSYYVRQLARAREHGALGWERLVVVDRDRGCRVATEPPDGSARHDAEVVVSEWTPFFGEYLAVACGEGHQRDAIVPSPLMPNLMLDWLVARARERWPERVVETRAVGEVPGVPWQRASPDGSHYVSFAEWMCPINCIEPARCPETRGPRSWSLPPAVREFVAAEQARGRPLFGPAIFHCRHRAFGVGMVDTADVVAGDRLVRDAGTPGAADVLVGTTSHCHGALGIVGIGG